MLGYPRMEYWMLTSTFVGLDRNRALENDLVAVELLCVDDVWGNKKEKEEKKGK